MGRAPATPGVGTRGPAGAGPAASPNVPTASSGQDRPFTLFGYLLLLNAGLGWVAYRRRWAVLTVGWAVEALALAWVYTLARRRPLLWAALALMALSVLKGFLLDMARLGGLYRVASFVGLAVCLALAAGVLQRFVFARRDR